jgi:serine protease Do
MTNIYLEDTKMERIVLRHLNGSKSNQVEEFPLHLFNELVFGRDPASTVKYDPDRDDLVGRQHAKILRDPADTAQFMITDLGSRNGTFVNKQRIIGTAKVAPGDLIQFGAGGPEFQFDIEPRPENALRPTRVADEPQATGATHFMPPTREGALPQNTPMQAQAMTNGTKVGKATVERMVTQAKGETQKYMFAGAAALMVIIVLVAGGLIYKSRIDTQAASQQNNLTSAEIAKLGGGLGEVKERTSAMTPAEISEGYNKSVVYIEMAWKLMNNRTGKQVFHQKVANQYRDKEGKALPILQNGPQTLAAYVFVDQNDIEPMFGDDPASGIPISGSGTGSGFVVTSDGFILTNRHVAASWRIPYGSWKRDSLPGVIMDPETGGPMLDRNNKPIVITDDRQQPQGWIPSDSRQNRFGKQIGKPELEGKNDYLNVTFPDNQLRNQALLKRVSDRHDVALIKVDIPQPLPKVDLNDNYETIKVGDAITILGYPGGARQKVVVVGTKTSADEPNQLVGIIPSPTLSAGYIGKILRGQEGPGKDTVVSLGGDVYQLTVNSTGGGNSGGPIFDDKGRVIAIFTYGYTSDFQVSGAVPIRFAKELMGITPVNQ